MNSAPSQNVEMLATILLVAACGLGYARHGFLRLREAGPFQYTSRALLVLSWLAGVWVLAAFVLPSRISSFAAVAPAAGIPWVVAFSLYRQRRRLGRRLEGEDAVVGGTIGAMIAGVLLYCGFHLAVRPSPSFIPPVAILAVSVWLFNVLESGIPAPPQQ